MKTVGEARSAERGQKQMMKCQCKMKGIRVACVNAVTAEIVEKTKKGN